MIVENFYSLSYSLQSPIVYLAKDNVTTDFNVNRVMAFGADSVSRSFNLRSLIGEADFDYLFLDAFYANKERSCKNIAFYNLHETSLVNFYLQDELNYQISRIVAKKTFDKDVILSLLLDNQDAVNLLSYTSVYNARIHTDGSRDTYMLSDFNLQFIEKKKIKKITSDFGDGFITLQDRSGRIIFYMPLSLLNFALKNEEVLLRDYDINIYESYITLCDNSAHDINLTFYY